MAIEGDLQALLAPLVSGRCYPIINTSDIVQLPYITYQVISNVPTVSLDGPSGLENRRIQIDAFAFSYGAMKALETSIKKTMAGSTIVNVPLLSMEQYEEDALAYRATLDFSIWS